MKRKKIFKKYKMTSEKKCRDKIYPQSSSAKFWNKKYYLQNLFLKTKTEVPPIIIIIAIIIAMIPIQRRTQDPRNQQIILSICPSIKIHRIILNKANIQIESNQFGINIDPRDQNIFRKALRSTTLIIKIIGLSNSLTLNSSSSSSSKPLSLGKTQDNSTILLGTKELCHRKTSESRK